MEIACTQSIDLFGSRPLRLDCGTELSRITVAYETYGRRNAGGSNTVLVCHALTGSAHAAGVSPDGTPGWWSGLIGPGLGIDTDESFVVCSNILGSCYGTTSSTPLQSLSITVRDMVRVQKELLASMGIHQLASVIGSSLGGMQVLEWALLYPEFCRTIIPISCSAKQTAWCLALNAAARAAIQLNPADGLAVARMIGMISYRSPEEFEERFGRKMISQDPYAPDNVFEIENYLSHQGRKLVSRFDPESYVQLTRAMDLYDITSGRASMKQALSNIRSKTLCIGVSSDIRYPTTNQKELAENIPDAEYAEIDSIHGHDSFLIEYDQLNRIVGSFLNVHAGSRQEVLQ